MNDKQMKAEKAYDEARELALKAYMEVVALARKAYTEAMEERRT